MANILEGEPNSGVLTINNLLARTEGRGLFMVIIVLCLPFVGPISVPGLSTPLGTAIIVIVARMLLGKPPRLPRRIGDRALPPAVKRMLSQGGVKFLRFVEKAAKPRRTEWMSRSIARRFNGGLLILLAFLLALPLPPIPPFTNASPSYTIVLLSASMMEEDGLLIWVGYAACLITLAYFSICANLILTRFGDWFMAFLHWLDGLHV